MTIHTTFHLDLAKIQLHWSLIKSAQTGLLLTTGLAGYMSARCPVMRLPTLLALAGSLFLTISGSTVLNMWHDRDIDARMSRTCHRPLPAGQVSPQEALLLGSALSVFGIAWAFLLAPLYGIIVSAGLFFDVVIYTIWLKRRTPWAILWGGIAGGMPVLAGRILGLGQIDPIGLLLALSVVLWVPTHILTFNLRYHSDFQKAGLPVFPTVYGFQNTRMVIAISSLAAALAIAGAAWAIGLSWGYLRLLLVLSVGLVILAAASLVRPSNGKNFGLFKYASVYMLSAMLLLSLAAL